MMKRQHDHPPLFLGLVLSLLFVLAFAIPAAGSENKQVSTDPALGQVVLRQNIIVDNTLVLLGDFFDGAGEKATIAVAYAPEPGKRAVFDANWLYRAANAYGLKWKPLSLKQQAVVKRETVTIGREEIEDHILAALIDKGVDPEMTVELSNRSMRLYVPSSSLASVIVENVDYDQRTKRFSAYVSTPDSKTTRVTGRLQKMLSVPVPNRRVLKGELINSQDIVWIKTPSDRVQPDIVMHPDDLIGKTPRRGLRSGSPVRSSDVQRPIIVKKGSLVTMILKTPMMTLTSQGQAIDNGSDGDVIRLTNTQSNTVIQAVVSGPGVVTITPASHLAMN
jgi:flagellar basal body P-ring formation protein FlgA